MFPSASNDIWIGSDFGRVGGSLEIELASSSLDDFAVAEGVSKEDCWCSTRGREVER